MTTPGKQKARPVGSGKTSAGRSAKNPKDYTLDPRNARRHPERNLTAVAASLRDLGAGRSIVVDREGVVIGGNAVYEKARELGIAVREIATKGDELVVVRRVDLATDDPRRKALALADNQIATLAEWDEVVLSELLAEVEEIEFETMGFASLTPEHSGDLPESVSLAERFLIPPFSVMNAREGWWQARKKAWLALGLQSELGRGNEGDGTKRGLAFSSSAQPISVYKAKNRHEADVGRKVSWEEFYTAHPDAAVQSGTSIFDPVLCELSYRWFCPPGGTVMDPFAGGSVRGIVAAVLGRRYVGIDLSEKQIEANRKQAEEICTRAAVIADPRELTPIEQVDDVWLKRDDLFSVAGVRGGKARTCWVLAQGAGGLVTAGSRQSPQVNIVAHIARALGVPCRVHTPMGELSPEVQQAQEWGAEVVQHKAGYNNVIIARAREDAKRLGWTEIPFGMECEEAVTQTRQQAANLPREAKRLVVPVGSGMSLAGVLWGLRDHGLALPVLGVCVGADPAKRLDKYAPPDWREAVTLERSSLDYHSAAPETRLGKVVLDAIYEAKCLPFLELGDCLWIVGVRATAAGDHPLPTWTVGDSRNITSLAEGVEADFVFSCPPYADLEVYSDNPADLSTLGYDDFRRDYAAIVAETCKLLKPDRFACFVVGEVRDKGGHYYDFVGDTVQAFRDGGLQYYNEAILVTQLGSLPVRVGHPFEASRKLGKTHQNVLVFIKGDAKKATKAIGLVEAGDPLGFVEEGNAQSGCEA
jgi:hypothetical protein